MQTTVKMLLAKCFTDKDSAGSVNLHSWSSVAVILQSYWAQLAMSFALPRLSTNSIVHLDPGRACADHKTFTDSMQVPILGKFALQMVDWISALLIVAWSRRSSSLQARVGTKRTRRRVYIVSLLQIWVSTSKIVIV